MYSHTHAGSHGQLSSPYWGSLLGHNLWLNERGKLVSPRPFTAAATPLHNTCGSCLGTACQFSQDMRHASREGAWGGGMAALPLYFIFGQKLRPTWLRQFDTSLSHFFFKASSPLTSRSGSATALVPIIISFCALYSHIINRHKGPQCNSSRELKNSYLLYSGTCLVPVSLGPGLTVSAQISKLYCIPPRTSKLYIKV